MVIRESYEVADYNLDDIVWLSSGLFVSGELYLVHCPYGVLIFSFSFIGIWYQTLVTPIKKFPGSTNTRTGLGGWSNRAGVFAYGELGT